jgi:hypothetical protein
MKPSVQIIIRDQDGNQVHHMRADVDDVDQAIARVQQLEVSKPADAQKTAPAVDEKSPAQ